MVPEVHWWTLRSGLGCGCLSGRSERAGWQWPVRSRREVWLWLNVEGEGLLWGRSDRFPLKPGMFALTGGDEAGEWACVRQAGGHRLEVVRMGSDWLRERLGGLGADLHSGLAGWLQEGRRVAFCGLMGVWEKDLCAALARAGGGEAPARLLAEARVLDWAAHRLFRNPAGGMERPVHGPVKHALQLLRGRLDQALDLAALAREVGVSPHHLSRIVRAESGSTLQQHLRRLRIEHACELLDTGRTNVTEAAYSCGYQSLSHFAKAFREETGKTPRQWLAERRQ